MKAEDEKSISNNKGNNRSRPPGYIKIIKALKSLLVEKDFNSITWAEISKTAGVNEGLIYKYFKDSRNLLHKVLEEYIAKYLEEVEYALKGIDGSLNKLRKLIWSQINSSNTDRVFARILILEVRAFPGYFKSSTYQVIKKYDHIILDIIEEGIANGEIRDDVDPGHIKRMLFGAAEHLCLPGVIFNRYIDPDIYTEDMCKIIFPGIRPDIR
jgi:TetR/AcrR family fatty acid metabolism transcriptional regulator